MKPTSIRASLAFSNMTDNTLITFARNIHTLLYAVPAFSGAPVTAPVLLAAIDDFAAAKAAQASGGKAATAEKNNKRDDLTAPLRKLANFVQETSDNDLAVLLTSGFDAMSTNRTRYSLSKPAILRIVAGMTGEALVTLTTESISRGCQVRVAEIGPDGAPGEFREPVFSTSSRNISVLELIPGKLFAFQGRTMGGTTTYSDWSDLTVQRAA